VEKGVFTLSLDFELIWGTLDLFGPDRFQAACEFERRVVIDRLLELLAEFEVPATWLVLGHLLLDSCRREGTVPHPEIHRPRHSWVEGDWFAHDPCADEQSHPTFYGRTLVEKIRACPVPQEIGSHSFSHVIFGDPGCSRDTADSELAASAGLAAAIGLKPRSFAFPRNSVGHLDLLTRHGLRGYRGPGPRWYERRVRSWGLDRIAHLAEVLAAVRPPVVTPEWTEHGLWSIPGSMIYFPMHGRRRHIPLSVRVRRAHKGLRAAVQHRKLFHLWFHPTNLADEPDRMFAGLRDVLARARALADSGQLDILPMAEVAERATPRSPA
jgi:peptidoglycan/xylan/chitin deacetylase (PgdA/CDA1 family)